MLDHRLSGGHGTCRAHHAVTPWLITVLTSFENSVRRMSAGRQQSSHREWLQPIAYNNSAVSAATASTCNLPYRGNLTFCSLRCSLKCLLYYVAIWGTDAKLLILVSVSEYCVHSISFLVSISCTSSFSA